MRTLATLAFSFSAAVFAGVLLPWEGWQLWAAAFFLLWGGAFALWRGCPFRRRGLLVTLALCAGLLYFSGYRALFVTPLTDRCGAEGEFSAVVCDYPEQRENGCRVTLRLSDFPRGRAYCYGGEELRDLRPGDTLRGTAYWKEAAYTTLTSRGVHVLLYDRDDLTVTRGSGGLRWWPQQAARAFQAQLEKIWSQERVRAFLAAELLGDKSQMVQEDYTALQETGLAHLFAVSGLHCAFLVSLVQLCIPPRRRRVSCLVTGAVLLFYMCMTGLSPSVVRACIMQLFLLTAPLFYRSGDSLTSLGAALFVILAADPYAAGSVSLQLSFAATLGLAVLTPRLFAWLRGLYTGRSRVLKKCLGFAAANLAATVGAMVFTAPLTAWYFNILSLISPLSGLLSVSVAGWSFMSGFAAAAVSFLWLPLGRALGALTALCVHYILWVARGLCRVPYHAVYFSNTLLRDWLLYSYAVFGVCLAFRRRGRRKYLWAAALAAASLCICLWLHAAGSRAGDLGVTALNVGQGESVLLYSGPEAAMVDCGSSTGYLHAGDIAADQLNAMGYTRLRALVVTHYHADHTNGLGELLTRVPVDTLYLPDIQDDYGVRDKLCRLALSYGSSVVWVTQRLTVPLGAAELTVFPPMEGKDLNERCVAALCSAGDFDVLITGDMPGDMEAALAERYDLPDTEVLVVSHHGSKYSSDKEFLAAVRPDTAIISVGENHYGHPARETLWRLSDIGAEIYRTDEAGHITVKSYGGEG